jgi:Holliday junction resolvase
MKRKTKFYYKDEKETMKELGLTPVAGSGSGWLNKEDGENEIYLAQLKSTDKSQITIHKEDLNKLEYHAQNSNKIPLFIVKFLQTEEVYIMVNKDDIKNFTFNENKNILHSVNDDNEIIEVKKKKISSTKEARDKFNKEMEEKWKKVKK